MLIDCYLFSEITQQIGHTYYSGLNHYHRIFYFNLCDFLQDRIPKERFEEYCEYMLREKERIHHADECVAAGYEILPKYKKQFYPYIIYSDIELALDLIEKDLQVRSYTSTLLLKSGYKIRNFDYNYREFDSIKKDREIFSKNEYKYI